MAQALADALSPSELLQQQDDALAFEHVESFNILCVGESGLGKSTFLRDIFAHLDPTKQQELKRRVAEQAAKVAELDDLIGRNETESKQCDDKRALELRQEKKTLRGSRDEARAALEALRADRRRQEHAVADLRLEIQALDRRVRELRGARDEEEEDDEAERLGQEVLCQQAELSRQQELLTAELRRSNLDRDPERDQGGDGQERGQGGGQGGGGQGGGGHGSAAAQSGADAGASGSGGHGSPRGSSAGQTRDVSARLIKGMPLYDGARQGLDVTLIDTPGDGDLL